MTRTAVQTRRSLYRGLAFVLALAVIGLWITFWRDIFSTYQALPAPGGIMLPVLFCCLAAGVARAAVKDEPIVMIMGAGFSLVPVGMVLAMMPGPTRWIGLCNVTNLTLGVLLLRSYPGEDPDSEGAAP